MAAVSIHDPEVQIAAGIRGVDDLPIRSPSEAVAAINLTRAEPTSCCAIRLTIGR